MEFGKDLLPGTIFIAIEPDMNNTSENSASLMIALTTDIVVAHLSKNIVAVEDVPVLITSTYDALVSLGQDVRTEAPALKPAVSIRSSVKPDYIVCLEDGRKLRTLKRYLGTQFDMTPEEYRTRWNLPADYPMVAPNYTKTRRELALKNGLGRRPASKRAGTQVE